MLFFSSEKKNFFHAILYWFTTDLIKKKFCNKLIELIRINLYKKKTAVFKEILFLKKFFNLKKKNDWLKFVFECFMNGNSQNTDFRIEIERFQIKKMQIWTTKNRSPQNIIWGLKKIFHAVVGNRFPFLKLNCLLLI